MRKVIVTDSKSSVADATADSISRRSMRFSAQNSASASSLSNSGTSSQFAMAFIGFISIFQAPSLPGESLIEFPLIKELFLRPKRPGLNDPDLFAISPVYAEHAQATGRLAQVKIASLSREPGGVRQQPDSERILKGL